MRNVDSRRGLNDVRTMQSVKKRSMPRIQGSSYLELYMLKKEKDRLLKENEKLLKEDERLLMKMEQTNKRIEEIDGEINKLQELETTKQTKADKDLKKHSFTQKQDEEKEWKEMSLDY